MPDYIIFKSVRDSRVNNSKHYFTIQIASRINIVYFASEQQNRLPNVSILSRQ